LTTALCNRKLILRRENENWRGMVFYMYGVLDEEVVGWTSSLALTFTPSHC
jgi:hypothetical protein